jgi:hypothetical protein
VPLLGLSSAAGPRDDVTPVTRDAPFIAKSVLIEWEQGLLSRPSASRREMDADIERLRRALDKMVR